MLDGETAVQQDENFEDEKDDNRDVLSCRLRG